MGRHVVVLAATNRPHVLDPALMRPGRFDRLIHVPLPDAQARAAIFARQLGRMQCGEGVEATSLAECTGNCSGAEVVMICREAALLAVRSLLESEGDCAATCPDPAVCASMVHFQQAIAVVQP